MIYFYLFAVVLGGFVVPAFGLYLIRRARRKNRDQIKEFVDSTKKGSD